MEILEGKTTGRLHRTPKTDSVETSTARNKEATPPVVFWRLSIRLHVAFSF
jgi:hypothetical protein